MKWRSLLAGFSVALANLAYGLLVALFMPPAVGLAQAEEPSAAAVRFYNEYMSMGVALKPLGDRRFTIKFRAL